MKKLKVIHLIPSLDRGGAEMSLIKLVKNTNEILDHEIMTFSQKGSMSCELEEIGIPVHTLNFKKTGYIKSIYIFYKFLKSNKFNIMQTWMYHADLFGLISAKLAGINSIFWNVRCSTVYINDKSIKKQLVLRTNAFLSKYVCGIITNAHINKEVHIKYGYHNKNWSVIPNAFDTDKFCPSKDIYNKKRHELAISSDEILIGFMARFDEFKDHETFLKVIEKLSIENKKIKGILVGRGIKNAKITNNYKKKLNDSLILIDEVCDTSTFYKIMDVHLLTSTSEGFPNVIGEAMSTGVPCVATNCGDCAEIIGDTGYISKAKDIQSIVNNIKKIIQEKSEKSEAARVRIINNYSINIMCNNYHRIYINSQNNT